MISDELYAAFRDDVVDLKAPYLWSEAEVYRYLNDAYTMFVRLTGGVPDFTSDVTQVPIVAGQVDAEVSTKILKFREARLASTGRVLDILNYNSLPAQPRIDYGVSRTQIAERTPGPVRAMVIGKQRGAVSWLQVPVENDSVSLIVDRLPLTTIAGDGQALSDVAEEHHLALLLWMKSLAYGKQDAETFDRGRRDEYRAEFTTYCVLAKAEMDRYKSRVRSIHYGGI